MVFPREIIVGHNTTAQVAEVCDRIGRGKSVLIVDDKKTKKLSGDEIAKILTKSSYEVKEKIVSSPTVGEVNKLIQYAHKQNINLLLGVGGGTVMIARFGGADSWGNYVVIDHGNGKYSLYAHLESYSVSSGETVTGDQVIGKVNSTGNSTGNHLHFGLYTCAGLTSGETGCSYNPCQEQTIGICDGAYPSLPEVDCT